jgi:hypothetical protein
MPPTPLDLSRSTTLLTFLVDVDLGTEFGATDPKIEWL